ncbi:dolichol kinase [Rhodotorula kratochvilovae]
MASASGSQTDGADGEHSSSSSESEGDNAVLRARIFGGEGLLFEGDVGSARSQQDGRRLSAPAQQWAGERGRGEHVLVQKRSASPSSFRSNGSGSSGHKERSWGSALLDTLEGNTHGKERRRPSSPALHALRGSRTTPRSRPSKATPEPPAVREPSPPLTLDSIRPGWTSPFPLYHIRTSLVFEVVILLIPLLFALFRLYTMVPTAVFPTIPGLPFAALLLFTLAVPFIALFRREEHYFKAPFTDERGYRDSKSADDGVAAALTLPVLLACAVWYDTYATADGMGRGVGLEGVRSLVDVWEANGVTAASSPRLAASFDPSILTAPLERARALFHARYELVLLTALNAACLLLHLALARTLFRIERLPRSNTKRFFGFMAVATTLSAGIWAVFAFFDWLVVGGLPIHPLEAAVTTHIQQSSFYLVSRLARRGFTLGELNTMTAAGNALCLEFWRLSWARWNYKRGFPYIPPTFRAPTPVIAFQAVLIPGAFLSGFLLSPLLVISRHIASKPSHRLKWPTERERHRKLLALGVAVGLAGIVVLPLGGWAGWMLGASRPSFLRRIRRPWGWALRFWCFGDSDGVADWQPSDLAPGWSVFAARRTSRGWRRLALVAYWGTTISSAIGGWQTHLVRKRRIRTRASPVHTPAPAPVPLPSIVEGGSAEAGAAAMQGEQPHARGAAAAAAGKRLLGMGMDAMQGAARMGAGAAGAGSAAAAAARRSAPMGRIGAESAREEKAVHASLNMRRKFFHALAVLMFVPGIAIDPAFTSLAFSVAFSLFTFAEYARYFALYPIGAPLHIFFSEFVDSKDGGPVILSHFYLLTGCAGGLWLEGRGINRYTGVLVLGIGDSLASIVGKLAGRTRWPGTSKTLEGTAAFISSVVLCAWLLRLFGVVEPFSLPRYILGVTLSALLEAASAQNDNLVIPLYMWSVVSLLSV